VFHLYPPHVSRLLKVLRQAVPDLKYYARMVRGKTADSYYVYIFGVRYSGEVVGGYEHRYFSGIADSHKEGMEIAGFFLDALAAGEEAVYSPPEIREMWESRYLREMMFPGMAGR
jgi:hypothetical protein